MVCCYVSDKKVPGRHQTTIYSIKRYLLKKEFLFFRVKSFLRRKRVYKFDEVLLLRHQDHSKPI